jgi:LysM repeat protein
MAWTAGQRLARQFATAVEAIMKPLLALALSVSLFLSLAGTAFADSRYVVQRGDNLFRIALRFHTSVAALARANHIADPSRIYVGQALTIPDLAPAAQLVRYQVRHGDTLYGIARSLGSTVAAIQSANKLATTRIYTGQTLLVPIH